MPCPTCGGKGELSKVCDLCKGTGKRPCPVCVKADRTEPVATPGRLLCDYCAGKGVVGGKPCPRCDGGQTLQCTSCGGKGSLPCRKTVTDKFCPTCKFVGKVPCTTCEGTLLVNPAVVASRRAAAAKKVDPTPQASQGSAGPRTASDPTEKSDSEEVEEPAVSFAELEARFNAVKAAYDSHLDVFAVDPRAGLDVIRGEASRLSKKLPKASKSDDSTGGRLVAWSEKSQRFRARWTELRSLFDDELKTFLPVQKLIKSRESRLNDAPKGRRDSVEAEVNRQIGIGLRVVEKRSAKLQAEDPSWLGRELANLESEWAKLKSAGESDAEEIAKKERDETEKAALAKKADRDAKEKIALQARALVARKPGPQRETEGPSGSSSRARSTPATATREETEFEPALESKVSAQRPGKTRGAAGEEPVLHGSLFWVALGAALASMGIWLASRYRRSEASEDAPPAVS